ncbi:rhodanese-like domain-containing protein [Sneathiella limimaris]|uniref:rhodanese-like domain-containing protein n=1 Tax=Sneathiella limimaris TaxID=1964213 RepID=UPI0019D0C4D8|nr:rhodanese-like domain-containing protein [Sneathiella limimaris]
MTTGINMDQKEYAGDITPNEAWDILQSNPDAILVDVRTNAEWAFVGVPDLTALNKSCHMISWVMFPDMSPNPTFLDQIQEVQADKSQPILFLCRSGVRSIAAAIAATKEGYETCYNILEGFEGDHDTHGHRGTVGGWKVRNLDWKQN